MRHTLLCLAMMILISHAFAQGDGQWQLLKTKNKADSRSECGLATMNGKLYLIGGDGPAAPVEVFDPSTLTWTKKGIAPVVMHHFQPVSLGNKIYVLEAFYQGNFPEQTPMPNAYSYQPATGTWQKLGGLPPERRRAAAGAATYQGKLYLVAGITHGHASGTNALFDVYDPITNTWKALPNAPHLRDHCEAVVVKDKLYAVGGRNTSYRDPKNVVTFFSQTVLDVDCYDFKTAQWSTLAYKLPLGSGGGSAVNLNDRIYYIGGERATAFAPNHSQKETFYLDPESTDGWIQTCNLNIARNGVGGAVLNNRIYIAGGAGGPGGPPPPQNGKIAGAPPHGMPPASSINRPKGHDGGIALEVFTLKQ